MAEIRHEWLTKYFDERPQIVRPPENALGFEIPYQWKCVVESLLAERERRMEVSGYAQDRLAMSDIRQRKDWES